MAHLNLRRSLLVLATTLPLLMATLGAQEDPDPVGFYDRTPFLQQLTAR